MIYIYIWILIIFQYNTFCDCFLAVMFKQTYVERIWNVSKWLRLNKPPYNQTHTFQKRFQLSRHMASVLNVVWGYFSV